MRATSLGIILFIICAFQSVAYGAETNQARESKQKKLTQSSNKSDQVQKISESDYWNIIKDSNNYKDYDKFLIKYPDGQYADLAQYKLGGGKWIKEINKGCFVFNPAPKALETVTWSGGCVDGIAHGKGEIEWKFDDLIQKSTTTMDLGRLNGQFKVDVLKNNKLISTIEGTGGYSKEGVLLSKIKQQYFDDNSKIVSFEGIKTSANNKEVRKGILIFKNGNKFNGESINGKPEGTGLLTNENGYKYEGDFKDGEQTGKATIVFTDGTKYIGDVLKGKPHGDGTLTHPSGKSMTTKFINGTPDRSNIKNNINNNNSIKPQQKITPQQNSGDWINGAQ
jgi:hypothetical protein